MIEALQYNLRYFGVPVTDNAEVFFCMNLNYVHYLVCDISYIMLPSNHIFVIFNISLFTEVTSDKHTMTSVYIFNVINVTDGPIQYYLSLW